MPFDDSELKNRLNTNKKLSDAEKNYATWARQNDQYIPYINNGRTKDSILTVVGHSIIGGNVPVIRAQTNTIDLDAAAYSTDSFLIYSVQSKSAGFILTDRDDVNQYVKAHMVILNDYLSSGKKASLAEEKDVVRYDPDESVFDDPAILTKDSAGGVVKEQEVFDDPDYLIGRHEVDYLSSTASISQVIPVGEYTVYSEEEAEEQNPDNLAKSKSPDDITPESAKDENPEVLKRPSS